MKTGEFLVSGQRPLDHRHASDAKIMTKFEQLIERDGPVILDGGFATQLESMGHDIAGDLWSAALLISDPQAIIDAHRAYLSAGAEIIISASYQASRSGFISLGYSTEEADQLMLSAVKLSQTACAEYLESSISPPQIHPIVAASVGPYGATMHDGSEYTGDYDISDEALTEFHLSRLKVLDASGADVLAVETIPNFREAEILCGLLETVSTPAWISFACRDALRISDGSMLRDVARLFAGHRRVHAVGINCTSPTFILPLIDEVRAGATDKPVIVYPNSGETYHTEDNSWSGASCDLENDFNVEAWFKAGAKFIGGCCRTSPADIRAIKRCLFSQAC